MKTKFDCFFIALMLLALSTINPQLSTAYAQGTAFNYNGRLNDGGNPANGLYDVTFSLFSTNAGGVTIAGPVTNSVTGVTNGLFMSTIDFGAGVFTGSNYWLELAVRTNGGSSFTTLAPRQPILPTPYAIYSANAGSAATAISAATATTAASANSVSAANIVGTVQLTQLPETILTNGGSSSVNLTGTFSGNVNGNGAGLTGVPGTLTWQNVTGTNQQAQSNTGYLANNAAQVTITLPASPNVGDIVSVSGVGAGGWQIGQTVVGYTNQYLYAGSKTNITLAAGSYTITAYGAQGGSGDGNSGGLGSEMEGQFNFTGVTTLTLLVGGGGGTGSYWAGGGGGSFVVNESTPLVVAGGGGGGGYSGNGDPGLTGTSGGGVGGVGGSGGAFGSSGVPGGGGGGGYSGNGGGGGTEDVGGGQSFINGGGGGGGGYVSGGYGGGGGGRRGGGGGGGYSGGGGGGNAGGAGGYGAGGGGGGSSYRFICCNDWHGTSRRSNRQW